MRPALRAALLLNLVQVFTALSFLTVPVLAPAIAADLGVSTTLLGAYSAIMWAGGLASSLAAGSIIGRLGALRISQASLVMCAAGLAAGAQGSLTALAILPLIVGFGCGVETPSSSQLLARVTPPDQRPFIFSLKQTGVQIGGMLTGLVQPALLPWLGWRGALAAGAAVTLAYAFALEPVRRTYDTAVAPRGPRLAAVVGLIGQVMRSRGMRQLAVASFGFHAMQIALNGFLVSFLVASAGRSLGTAGALLAGAQFGGFLGRLGSGMIAGRRLPTRQLLAGMGFAMSAAAVLVGLAGPAMPLGMLAVACVFFGVTSSGWNGVFFAEIVREAPVEEVGHVTGGMLFTAYAGLILGPLAFGAVAAIAGYGIAYAFIALWSCAGALVLLGHAPPARTPPDFRR
jgi:MFS family permease